MSMTRQKGIKSGKVDKKQAALMQMHDAEKDIQDAKDVILPQLSQDVDQIQFPMSLMRVVDRQDVAVASVEGGQTRSCRGVL